MSVEGKKSQALSNDGAGRGTKRDMDIMLWTKRQREREGDYTCERRGTIDGEGGATVGVMDADATDGEQTTVGGEEHELRKQTWKG